MAGCLRYFVKRGFVLAGLVTLVSSVATAQDWSTQTVDAAGSDGAFHSLAFSPVTGFPAIAYSGTSGRTGVLKLATWNGATWTIQTVDSASSEPISLAFDPAGNPAISYGNGQVKFARWTGTSWSIQAIDSNSGISSLKFHNGQPSIAYGYSVKKGNKTTNQLRLASLSGPTWTIETVVDGVSVLYPSLAFASDGSPSVAYGASGNLNFAQKSGSTWSSQSIEAGGTFASLAYDPLTGYPTIAHVPGPCCGGGVRFDRWDGSQWISEIVVASGAGAPSLAYDGGGIAAISYRVAPGPNGFMQLWFSSRTGCSGTCWTNQLVQDFSPVLILGATSLAFSPTGAAGISFGDYTNRDLKFAQQGP